VVVGVGIQRFAGRAGEDPVTVGPELPRPSSFLVLRSSVVAEQRDKLIGQSDGTFSRATLGLTDQKIHPDFLRAEAGVSPALVAASVFVDRPESRPFHSQLFGVEINVSPAKRQRLTLPQSERQRDGPPCTVPVLFGLGHDPLCILDRVRLNFLVAQARTLRDLGDIALHMSAPQCLPQCNSPFGEPGEPSRVYCRPSSSAGKTSPGVRVLA